MRSGGASFKEAAAAAADRAGCRLLGDGGLVGGVPAHRGQPGSGDGTPCSQRRADGIPASWRRLGLHRSAGPEPRQFDGAADCLATGYPQLPQFFGSGGIRSDHPGDLAVVVEPGDTHGVAVHAVQGSWDENSITAVNAPAIGGAASETGPISAQAWAFADVTRLVPGNGLVSFALTEVGSGHAELGSKEGAHSPELLIQTQLTRYPYLTDVAARTATVNFGTDQSNDSAVVKWGRVGAESCTAHTTTATKTSIMVNGSANTSGRRCYPRCGRTPPTVTAPTSERRRSTCCAPTRRRGSPPGFRRFGQAVLVRRYR